MPCAIIACACSALSRIASNPPCPFGCRVLTRPSIISGNPVSSETSVTFSPAAAIALAVPPVETRSMPWAASARANSISPDLSETDNNARVTRRGWSVMRLSQAASPPRSTVLSATKPVAVMRTSIDHRKRCAGRLGHFDLAPNCQDPENCRGVGCQFPRVFVSSGLGFDGRDVTDIFGAFRVPSVVGGLHPGPDSRSIAKKLAKPNCNGRRHRLSLLQDVVKMLARNPEQAGDLRLGPTGGWNDIFAKQRTGMSRAAAFAALRRIDHVRSFNGIARNRCGRLHAAQISLPRSRGSTW